jgi:hypothetical protein
MAMNSMMSIGRPWKPGFLGRSCELHLQRRDAVGELAALQNECDAWLQSLPDSLQQSATAEALQAICDLDIVDLQAIEPPRGFGRD